MRWLVSSILLSAAASASALEPGDLIFTGMNLDNEEGVSALALVDIPGGTTIFITDNALDENGALKTNEGTLSWTTADVVAAGTEVLFRVGDDQVVVSDSRTDDLLGAGGNVALNNGGDQVLMYTGSEQAPEFVTGITLNGWLNGEVPDNESSNIPAVLSGTDFMVDPTRNGSHIDNGVYDCTSGVSGTADALAELIGATGAYTTSGNALSLPAGCDWVIESECDDVCDPNDPCSDDCAILDTFAADLDGWTAGNSAASGVTNPPGGLGGDAYLSTSATGGGGSGSNLVVFNTAQWTGDWTSNGRTTVYFHARASVDVTLRVIVETNDSRDEDAISTVGVTVPGDGEWHIVSFDVSPSDFTNLGQSTPEAILADVTKFRIVHASGTAGATPIAATLDLDNISTSPLSPECGDSAINGLEVCDGLELGGADCTDEGYADPVGASCNECGEIVYTECAAVCGDGNTEPGEECDDAGASATCDADCTDVESDDGICNAAAGETPVTAPADCADVCGDGLTSGDEECDGADLNNGACTDLGYAAGGTLTCSDSCLFDDAQCVAECGNGVSEPGEACDDGEVTADCTAACTVPECGDTECNGLAGEDAGSCPADCPDSCGDGLVTGGEQCDGADLAGQTCVDFGFATAGALSCDANDCTVQTDGGCTAVCGNATQEPGEACDDGNLAVDDGCSDVCTVEDGWDCNQLDGCVEDCGDGLVTGEEECDDENTELDDGCDDGCLVEDTFVCDDAEPSVCQSDVDEDGVADDDDNCPDDANPDQEDADDNGIGDACDDVDPDTDTDVDTDPDTDAGTDIDVDDARCGCQASPWNASWLVLGLVVFAVRRRS